MISVSQLLQVKELRYSPFQKTLVNALGLNKDENLLPLEEKINYEKLKDEYEQKRDPNILTLNTGSERKIVYPISNNELMFEDVIMKKKFGVKSLTTTTQQERFVVEGRNNNFIDENDKPITKLFNNVNSLADLNKEENLVGSQNVSFFRFCKAMKVFNVHSAPEEKIKCKL